MKLQQWSLFINLKCILIFTKKKAEKAKQRGKKVKDKVTKKLKKKNDINYQNYVGHHSLAGKYFDAYRNQ